MEAETVAKKDKEKKEIPVEEVAEEVPTPSVPKPKEALPAFTAEEALPSLIFEALTFLAEKNREGFAALAREHRLLPDALADAVNDALYDRLGDVALEETGDGWQIVPDYLEEITPWMKK